MKYRKKPVVVEAVQWNGMGFNLSDLPEWFVKAYQVRQIDRAEDKLHIVTLEGIMTANADDYIIQGVKGEIYPCKPDIFEATYEKVEEENSNQLKINFEKTMERNEK